MALYYQQNGKAQRKIRILIDTSMLTGLDVIYVMQSLKKTLDKHDDR